MTGTTLNLIFKSLTIIIHFGIFKKKKIHPVFRWTDEIHYVLHTFYLFFPLDLIYRSGLGDLRSWIG